MPIIAMSGILDNILGFLGYSSIQEFLIIILVLCISLSLHEVAHGWVAYKLGDDTAYLAGRLTLNPLAHLDLIGSLCFIFAHIGWAKPVPINPTKFDRKYTMKKGIVLTSLAGPGSNLIMAIASTFIFFIVATIAALAGVSEPINVSIMSIMGPFSSNTIVDVLLQLFKMLYFYNVILAVFNLLPIPPMDGFKIFGALLPNQLYYKIMSYERYIGMAFLFLVLFGRDILSTILQVITAPFYEVIWTPINALFTLLRQSLGLI